jgi:hypothetical protein
MVDHTNRVKLVRARERDISDHSSYSSSSQGETIKANGLIRDENFRPIDGKYHSIAFIFLPAIVYHS